MNFKTIKMIGYTLGGGAISATLAYGLVSQNRVTSHEAVGTDTDEKENGTTVCEDEKDHAAWDMPQVPPTTDLAAKLRWLGYVNRNGGW